uniref:Major facilitator superfamily (MFS) profile domain-containing protein n=1 Tax=Haptolina ericina TaxID=156174 RepID=A0A7S3FCU7_9EUKA
MDALGLKRIVVIFPAATAILGHLMYVMSVTSLEPILAPYLSDPPFGLEPVQLGLLSTANTLCFIVFVGIASYTVGHVGPLVQAIGGQFAIALGLFFIGPAPIFSSMSQSLGLTWTGLCISACGNAFAIVTSAALIARALQARGIPAEQATNAIAALLQQAAGIGAICGNLLGGTLGDHFGFRSTTAGIGCAYLVLPLLFAYSHPWELNFWYSEKPKDVAAPSAAPYYEPPRADLEQSVARTMPPTIEAPHYREDGAMRVD